MVSDDGHARDNLATSPGAPRFMKDAAEGEGEPQGRHGKRDGYDAFDAGGGVRTLVGDRVGDAAGSGRKGHVAHSAIVSPGAPAFMKRSVEQAGEGGGRYGGVRAQLEAVADGDGATPSKGLRTHIAHGADEHSAGRRAGATVVSDLRPLQRTQRHLPLERSATGLQRAHASREGVRRATQAGARRWAAGRVPAAVVGGRVDGQRACEFGFARRVDVHPPLGH